MRRHHLALHGGGQGKLPITTMRRFGEGGDLLRHQRVRHRA